MYTEDDICIASTKVTVSPDDTVAAQVFLGKDCGGDSLGGDTGIGCGNCTVVGISDSIFGITIAG
eukprot:COSAG02_NODE_39667_length_414_cov_0.926984_1_plen_64_part_01